MQFSQTFPAGAAGTSLQLPILLNSEGPNGTCERAANELKIQGGGFSKRGPAVILQLLGELYGKGAATPSQNTESF